MKELDEFLAKKWNRTHKYLSVEEAEKALSVCATKEELESHDGDIRHALTRAYIFYDGKWRRLHRTDLMDDVGTLRDAGVKFYKQSIGYGARVTEDGFGVIDSFSDG